MRAGSGEAGVFVGEKVARVDDRHIVDAVAYVPLDGGHVVLAGRGRAGVFEPDARRNASPRAETDDGVKARRL